VKFALLVTAGPFQAPAPETALAFAEAVLAEGHELCLVFFHHDGVHNANRLAAPPTPETNLVRRWSELARRHGVDLAVCSTAGLRRGVREANLAPGFRIAGLGLWAEAALAADRCVSFA
jgi:tRNA 2-thiouridine synthesizing protein D